MTARQIDELYEAESARIWEELNAPDPCEEQMKAAAKWLKEAVESLNTATDWVADAACELMGTPMESIANNYCEKMEEILFGIRKLQEKYGRGER